MFNKASELAWHVKKDYPVKTLDESPYHAHVLDKIKERWDYLLKSHLELVDLYLF
jgi:hypothetical protein